MTQPHSRPKLLILVLFALHAAGAEGDAARGMQTLFAGTHVLGSSCFPAFPPAEDAVLYTGTELQHTTF